MPATNYPRHGSACFAAFGWSCFVRDRWLSLVKGRPLRIDLEDCDLPLPVIDDIAKELDALPLAVRDRYIPYQSDAVARLWIKLVRISVTLGNILRVHYRCKGPRPSVEDIEKSEEEVQGCVLNNDEMEYADPTMQLFAYQFQLFYEYDSQRNYSQNGTNTLRATVHRAIPALCFDRPC